MTPGGDANKKAISVCFVIFLLAFLPFISSSHAFTASTLGDYGNITVMEVSGNYDANNPDGTSNVIPRQEIAKEFFLLHKDDYDFLVILMPKSDVMAFYSQVKNDTTGIGLRLFDNSSLFGSDGTFFLTSPASIQ